MKSNHSGKTGIGSSALRWGLLAGLLAVPGLWAGGAVNGALKVSGTKLKATGDKPDNPVVVYLEKKGSHDYPAPPKKHAVMDQKSLVFIPHVMAVQKGITVDFLNSDAVDHNVFCMDDCCQVLEPGKKKTSYLDLGNWGKGEVRSHTFNLTGEAVLLCKLHPDMEAHLMVVESPWFTVAKVDGATQAGKYSLTNVPPGDYVLKVWNKRCGAEPQAVTVKDGKTTKADLTLTRKKRRRH